MRALLLLLLLLGGALGTRVNFDNRCTRLVQVIATESGEDSRQMALLNSGQRFSAEYWEGGMSFKDGWTGRTTAHFAFASWNGMDDYDLSVINGFDTGMAIATDRDGPTITCREPNCPDAFVHNHDEDKDHFVPTGGIFTLTFCP